MWTSLILQVILYALNSPFKKYSLFWCDWLYKYHISLWLDGLLSSFFVFTNDFFFYQYAPLHNWVSVLSGTVGWGKDTHQALVIIWPRITYLGPVLLLLELEKAHNWTHSLSNITHSFFLIFSFWSIVMKESILKVFFSSIMHAHTGSFVSKSWINASFSTGISFTQYSEQTTYGIPPTEGLKC